MENQMEFDFGCGVNVVEQPAKTPQVTVKKLVNEITSFPKGIEWFHKSKSENFWNVCKVGILDDDAFFELKDTSHVKKTRRLVIRDFRKTSYCAVCLELYEDAGSTDTFPLGQNFDDCLSELQERGMSSGYFRKVWA